MGNTPAHGDACQFELAARREGLAAGKVGRLTPAARFPADIAGGTGAAPGPPEAQPAYGSGPRSVRVTSLTCGSRSLSQARKASRVSP